jgi:hypothetical protein
VSYTELAGPEDDAGLKFLVRAHDGHALARAVLRGAQQRLGRPVSHLRELGAQGVLPLAPEEQYLVATGRTYFKGIGPKRDRLGVLLALVDQLVQQRLAAKANARLADKGSAERFTQEAISAAMKLVVNSAYGYLGAVGLTRFADVHAANEVTRRGREVLLGSVTRRVPVRGERQAHRRSCEG